MPRETIPRLFRSAAGLWYWKPSATLRRSPLWRTRPLGEDRAQAETEALRLNRLVEAWRARGGDAAAEAARPTLRRKPATVAGLIAVYRASTDWKLLAPSTRVTYADELARLERRFGDVRTAAVTPRDVDEWLDELRADRPEAARHLGARARALWAWGVRKGLAPRDNPWAKAGLGGGGKRDVYVDVDGLRALVRAADRLGKPGLGTAAIIGFAAIARETDVLRLTRADLPTGAGGRVRLVYRQRKSARRLRVGDDEAGSGRRIDVACPSAILTRLVTHPPAPTVPGFLVARIGRDGKGRPWTRHEAARAWREIAETAARDSGRPELALVHLRDMRRSGYVHAVIACGVPIATAAALSGHSYRTAYEMAEHYAPKTSAAADATVAAMKVEI